MGSGAERKSSDGEEKLSGDLVYFHSAFSEEGGCQWEGRRWIMLSTRELLATSKLANKIPSILPSLSGSFCKFGSREMFLIWCVVIRQYMHEVRALSFPSPSLSLHCPPPLFSSSSLSPRENWRVPPLSRQKPTSILSLFS